ncbi:hypothetical protein [Aeribacillus sp. FSL W8-0870]|jgi:hypothetical protein
MIAKPISNKNLPAFFMMELAEIAKNTVDEEILHQGGDLFGY